MKKRLTILVLLLLISLSLPMMASAQELDTQVLPDKIETVKAGNGQLVEVKYFDSQDKLDEYKKQKMSQMAEYQNVTITPEIPSNSAQPMALLTSYQYKGASGYIGKDFDVKVYVNRTNSTQSLKPTVKRSVTDSVSISLAAEAEFKKVFKASTNVTFGHSETKEFHEEFGAIKIPPQRQLEIWTNNIAKQHTFVEKRLIGSDRTFTAYQATNSWKYELVVGPIRDPY